MAKPSRSAAPMKVTAMTPDHPRSRGASTVAPDVLRLTAGNAGPLTATGTNSYLVGRESPVLIDPGPDDAQHLAAILAALDGRRLAAIVVSHAHADHAALAPALARATGVPVLARGPSGTGQSAAMAALVREGLRVAAPGADFACDASLADGAALDVDGDPMAAIHTPGHCSNHICLSWRGILFSGDHVMGWATSVVIPPDGDMADYMASLGRLSRGDWRLALPGHGAAIADPAARIDALTRHRLAREAAILAALTEVPRSVAAVTAEVYADVPSALVGAARLSCLAHLIALAGRGAARRTALVDGLPEFFRD